METSDIVYGYKALKLEDNKLIDRYGNSYEVGKEYHIDGDIRFGKNGYHFCAYPEDTFRYVDGFNDNVVVTSVLGYGNIDKYDDEYYDYCNMYASSYMKILKVFTRDELIDNQINDSHNIDRFIYGYKLSLDELIYISDNYYEKDSNIQKIIAVYLLDYNIDLFDSFIKNANLSDDDIGNILKSLSFSKLDDSDKDSIRHVLGEVLLNGRSRVRK